MLTQLLPSSTVAAAVRLNTGLGMVASEMPGGTRYPSPPFSGGTRAGFQSGVATAKTGEDRIHRAKHESRAVIGRSRVATNTDIPISRSVDALSSRGLVQRRNQSNQILLAQESAPKATDADVESTILPEQIVLQNRVRDRRAIGMVSRADR